jgi:hypothetical protein
MLSGQKLDGQEQFVSFFTILVGLMVRIRFIAFPGGRPPVQALLSTALAPQTTQTTQSKTNAVIDEHTTTLLSPDHDTTGPRLNPLPPSHLRIQRVLRAASLRSSAAAEMPRTALPFRPRS